MKLINSNRFYLEGTNQRFIHLATVHHGLREFMCFTNKETSKTYIEEISGGHLEFIEDDELAQGISDFLRDQKVLDIGRPILPDDQWLRIDGRKNT